MDLDYPSGKMIDLNNNCLGNENKNGARNRHDGKGPLKCGSKDSGIGGDHLGSNDARHDGDHLSDLQDKSESPICSKSLLEQHVEELSDLLSGSSKTNSIIDATPNGSSGNLLVNSDLSPVTAIEAVSGSRMDQSPNQSSLLDESNLIDSNGDELDFDDNSLGNVTQCFNIKTEPDDTLFNETGRQFDFSISVRLIQVPSRSGSSKQSSPVYYTL